MSSPVLISVHVPKAGGTSTGSLLGKMFPGDELLLDYAEDPAQPLSHRQIDPVRYLQMRVRPPPHVRAIHGHFHPAKYLDVPGARWFTVLRRPPELLISIYWFFESENLDAPLHRYFIEESLTVEELARLPILNRLLSETYFGGVDMHRFDVIGRHEERAEALRRLADLAERPLTADEHLRRTPGKQYMQEMLHDDALIRRLESILADDMRFYERWVGA